MKKIDLKALADDFKNLNPKDIGAWPAVPRFTVLFVLLAAILTAGWWFLWDAQLTELAGKQKEEQQLRDDWVNKKRQAVNLDLYQAQLAEINQLFGALLKQLPSKTEIESLLVEINQAGLGRGLQFELFKPGVETNRDFYAELPIAVKLTGTYHDLGAFASDIGALSRIVTLKNIALQPVAAANPSGELTLDAVTMTYRALDENEVAAASKAAKGGKKK